MKEAMLYQKENGKSVRCIACEHRCLIADGQTGICRVRENENGALFSLVYGKLIAEHIDPIEKKPLFHFLPETQTYSIATIGCNFSCVHCQNADISQFARDERGGNRSIPGKDVKPAEVVSAAIKNNCPSISYTYTEPTIFVEFAFDTMKLARQKGLKNVWVSNGYFSKETFDIIEPYLDAINVDLKFFRDETYVKICGAHLNPVIENIKKLADSGIHQEITTLVIPGLNDSAEELTDIAQFLVRIDKKIPWHVSAFHPSYKLTRPSPTPRSTLDKARSIGKSAGLVYVY
ncbi:AmmeMemoRadiSam system radical SAM enzyme [Candidatus Falkowbacteria bacterium]|nr:AmmeMemoRadiSam system radical SAM enzyme [Candidatus Falkowbacteria bacterium]